MPIAFVEDKRNGNHLIGLQYVYVKKYSTIFVIIRICIQIFAYYCINQKIIYKYVISFLNMVQSILSWIILVERRHISWVYEQTKECIILYDSCKDKITSWLILLSDS